MPRLVSFLHGDGAQEDKIWPNHLQKLTQVHPGHAYAVDFEISAAVDERDYFLRHKAVTQQEAGPVQRERFRYALSDLPLYAICSLTSFDRGADSKAFFDDVFIDPNPYLHQETEETHGCQDQDMLVSDRRL